METTVKERLITFIKQKRISQKKFEEACGLSNGYLNSLRHAPSATKLQSILEAYPNINQVWLLTGVGEMLNEEQAQEKPVVSTTTGRPYFNVDFVAGFDLMVNDQTTTPDYLIDFAPFNGCDCWINARGDSMAPTISSGDIIALKRVQDFSVLINGEIYAIVTSSGLRTIKRVQDDGDTLTLIPDNPAVARQSIPKAIVTHVYRLLGSLKIF